MPADRIDIEGLNNGFEEVVKGLYDKYFRQIRTSAGRAEAPGEFKEGLVAAKKARNELAELCGVTGTRTPSVPKALRAGFDNRVQTFYATFIKDMDTEDEDDSRRLFEAAFARAKKALDETMNLNEEI